MERPVQQGEPKSFPSKKLLQAFPPAAPDAGGWEKELFSLLANLGDTTHFDEISLHISSLLASEREKAIHIAYKGVLDGDAALHHEMGLSIGAKAERSRLLKEVKKLRKECKQHQPGLECWGYEEYYNKAVDAALKIIKGEDII